MLIDIISEGYDENEFLEFKSIVNTETKKIPITACAFANTNGGVLVFGVDNDRSKKIHNDERLVGLEDSDQLKSQINNQIQRLRPPLEIENVIFRDTNIKLPNGKVIVILKILKSLNRPHQYNDIFYKRVANQNVPMEVSEIKNMFLQSQKTDSALGLLQEDGSYLLDALEALETAVRYGWIEKSLNNLGHLHYEYFKNFLYNHVYYYSREIRESLLVLVRELDRLHSNEPAIRARFDTDESSTVTAIFISNIESAIEKLKEFSKLMGVELLPMESPLKSSIEQEIREDMANKIKSSTENTNLTEQKIPTNKN